MFDFIRKTALALALGSILFACGGMEGELEAGGPEESADDALVVLPIYTRIAYRGAYDLRIIRNDGAQDALLVPGARMPSFSEHRTRVAYIQGDALKVMDAPFDEAALAAAVTVYTGQDEDAPATLDLSADGTKIIFATAGIGGWGADIKRATVGSSLIRTVVNNSSTWVSRPVFTSREAGMIAYNEGSPSLNNGMLVRTLSPSLLNASPTSGLVLVTQAYSPKFRLAGDKMVFHRYVSGRGYDLFIADSNGQNVTAWDGNSNEDDSDATFSGGGGSIAFVSKRSFIRCSNGSQFCVFRNTDNISTNLVTGTLSASSVDVLTNFSAQTGNILTTPAWR